MFLYLLFIVILLVLSAFFSGSETAIFALDRVEAKELAWKGVGPLAKIYRRINHFLPTVLLLNLLANCAIDVLATVLTVEKLGGEVYLPLTGIIATVVILAFAEIAPKVIAVNFSRPIAYCAAWPFVILITVLRPLTAVLTSGCRVIQQWAFWKPLPILTAEELQSTVEDAVEYGDISAPEGRILRNIIDFRQRWVRDFMTPRKDVIFIPVDTPSEEIRRCLRLARFARLPVTEGKDIDSVIGCVHVKEVLLSEKPDLRRSLRPMYFAPECMIAGTLFHTLREGGIHQSIIVDEYGQVVGLVSVHDLIEELIGDISDEYTPEAPWVARKLTDGWVINATISISTINEQLGLSLPAGKGKTLGGFLFNLAGHLPARGDKLHWGDWTFTVQVVRRKRIAVVRLKQRGGR